MTRPTVDVVLGALPHPGLDPAAHIVHDDLRDLLLTGEDDSDPLTVALDRVEALADAARAAGLHLRRTFRTFVD